MHYLLFILRFAFPGFVARYEHQQARRRARPIWQAMSPLGDTAMPVDDVEKTKCKEPGFFATLFTVQRWLCRFKTRDQFK